MAGVRLDEAQPVGLKPDPQELRNGGSPIGRSATRRAEARPTGVAQWRESEWTKRNPVRLKPDPQELCKGGSPSGRSATRPAEAGPTEVAWNRAL